MNIALVHNLGGGGAKRVLFEQARRLAEAGHQLDLFVPASANEEFLPVAPLCRRVRVYGEKNAAAPASSGGHSALGGLRRLARSALGQAGHDLVRDFFWVRAREHASARLAHVYEQIARDVVLGDFDVLYVHQCATMLAPDVLRFVAPRRVPTVFLCHDTLRRWDEWALPAAPGYDAARPTLLRRKRRGRIVSPVLERFAAREQARYIANTRAAGVVLANSWYSREALLRATGVNARVCYPGVDGDFFRPDAARAVRKRRVLSVGALVPGKRHDFILEAVARLPADRRPALLIVGYGGDGAYVQCLRSRAAEAGVSLVVESDVTDEALRRAYQSAAVVAFAPYLEPFGIVPLEALACATPVVGIAEGGVRESVRDNVTGLLTGGDPAAFARALERVVCEPALAARLGNQGRVDVTERWTWEGSQSVLEAALAGAASL